MTPIMSSNSSGVRARRSYEYRRPHHGFKAVEGSLIQARLAEVVGRPGWRRALSMLVLDVDRLKSIGDVHVPGQLGASGLGSPLIDRV
jgi:hypothetical protein